MIAKSLLMALPGEFPNQIKICQISQDFWVQLVVILYEGFGVFLQVFIVKNFLFYYLFIPQGLKLTVY